MKGIVIMMALRIIKTVFVIAGIFLIVDSCVLLFNSFNSSKLFSAFFGCGLIAVVFLDNFLLKLSTPIFSNILRIAFLVFILSFIVMQAFIIFSANMNTKKGDAVIVLGAGLVGKSPSALLAQRLDTAVDFLNDNTGAVCVVSGGQGKDEMISEAEAMKIYLLKRDIDESRILTEDKSTSTDENFEYSKKILDEYFGSKSYTCVYTTNSFHAFRAGLIAKREGVNATPNSAPTLWYTRNNYYIREYFGMLKYLLLGD